MNDIRIVFFAIIQIKYFAHFIFMETIMNANDQFANQIERTIQSFAKTVGENCHFDSFNMCFFGNIAKKNHIKN